MALIMVVGKIYGGLRIIVDGLLLASDCMAVERISMHDYRYLRQKIKSCQSCLKNVKLGGGALR
jgi:hypothetical protein